MSPKIHRVFVLCFLNFFADEAIAVTLTSGQTDYTTTSDITTSASGIISSLSGSSSSLNKIKNTYTITTGNSGATSSAYGIKVSGTYNQITNDTSGSIITTGSSGRGISVTDNSAVYNLGSIATQGTTSYGIYAGGDGNTVSNSGSITTVNTTSYGIYLNGDNNSATNSGSINTRVYGIYSNGDVNQITNSGSITTTSGSTAYGIYVSAGSASTASSSSYSTINNSGTISSNSHGIYVKDNYTQISNSGSITTSGSSIYGIRNEGDNSSITNSGTITATTDAIYNSGSGAVINNLGTLTGGVRIGSGTLNIFGGSISGVVDGTSNAGNVNVGSSSYSAVTFNQTAAFSDINILKINASSVLNSAAEISATNIFIDNSATLNLNSGSSVSGSIQGLEDGYGTLNIAGISFSASNSIGVSGNSLANLNINSAVSLTASSSIYANNIYLDGTLNFLSANNLTIDGNLTGSGSGVINVGSQNQTISGNLSLNSGDELALTLKDGGSGSLAVSGSAAINSNTKLAITTSNNQGYIANGTQYNIISTTDTSSLNAISDQNISVNGVDSNIYGMLKFTTEATSSGLVLDIDRLSAAEVTANKNSQNIYQALTDIGSGSSGKLLDFQEYLDSSGSSGDQLTNILNQLAPQSSKAALASTNNIANNSINIAENHLEKRRHNSENILKNGAWGQFFGGSIAQDSVGYDQGYKTSSAGFMFGSDREISDSMLIGAAVGLTKSAIKSLDYYQKNLVDSYHINFYSSKNFDKYFIDSFAGFVLNHYDSSRSITALNANANAGYLGQTYVAKIKTGLVQNLRNGFFVSPELSLNFLRNQISGYSENGADELNLRVGSVAANFFEARSGLNLGVSSRINELPEFRKISALLKISYGYSFVNDAPTTIANFQGQSTSFNSQISGIDRGSLKLGFEVMAYQKDDATFSVDYNYERKTTYSSHLALFKVRQEF